LTVVVDTNGDITHTVTAVVDRNGIADGLLHVDALGATAAVMIQENWDDSSRRM
jgi:thiamine phosphate synthase YjbQ (UPF0047 family)